jgi:hypothetical protein
MAVRNTLQTEIAWLKLKHAIADELRTAITVTCNSAEASTTQCYWFKCPDCTFEWPTWFKSSIVFISLTFVTDKCPNCRKKNVPAFKVE